MVMPTDTQKVGIQIVLIARSNSSLAALAAMVCEHGWYEF